MSTSNSEQMALARRKLLEKRLAAKRGASTVQAAPLPKAPADEIPLASHGQQSLWYMQQRAPQNATYNVINATRLEGEINIPALQASFDHIVARHEILRTNFVLVENELQQVIHPPGSTHFDVVDVAAGQIEIEMRQRAEAPFDLAKGALLRVALLRESPSRAVLLIVVHHIIADEWSLDVLLWRELSACYVAFCNGDEPQLPTLPTQFRDFAHWQRAKVGTPAYDKQLAYWRDQLANTPKLLQLPLDHQRPPTQHFEGEVLFTHFPASLATQLQALSREANTTLFVTLLTAYGILLQRLSGQETVNIGTVADLRTHSQLEEMIGYLLNTLVLPHRAAPDQSFRQVLAQVRGQMLRALENREIEFDQVVKALRPQRDPSYNPFFQTMFVMWDASDAPPKLAGLKLTPFKLAANVAKFDLTLYAMVDSDDRLLIGVEFSTRLFQRATVERLLEVYQTLLESIVANPDAAIQQLDCLPASQRQTLLHEWTQTAQPFPDDVLVHDLIAAHPADHIAVRQEGITLSYGELNKQANKIAHKLLAQGVTPNTAVGLLVERSPQMLVGILGILRAGAAYVPIDPAYPDERIQYMLYDAGISILLTQSHIEQQLPQGVTRYDLDSQQFAAQPATTPDVVTTPDDLAYIIYTSGSTGRPKGVRATHRNLVHSTTARYSVYPDPIERFLLLSSFAFDSSLVGIFWSLCGGGTLCLPLPGQERDVAKIAQLIREYGITHLLALPSLYSILLEFSAADDLQSLNTVIVAGEACPQALVQAHFERLPKARLYNEYGPTEGTVWATVAEVIPATDVVTIGKAIPNMQTYIVDPNMRPVPIGVVGELLIGGAGITGGYHKQAALTASRFIDNPFGAGKLYRTGDLGRYRVDGEMEYWGRVDNQVKVSGYRIELGEVENALNQLAAVREAVVLVQTEAHHAQLLGAVVLHDGYTATRLREKLQDHLPHYMLPTCIVDLPDIPRTPNGKVDRDKILAALPAIAEETTPARTADSGDAIERELITIWEDLLERPVPDVNADFFALGGYSLLAVRMFARIKQAFDLSLSESALFLNPTIAGLADFIRDEVRHDDILMPISSHPGSELLVCFQLVRFGGLLHYKTFFEKLSSTYTMYGIMPPASDDGFTVEELAAIYARVLRSQLPAQKCYFVGTSADGIIAYETARLMASEGYDIHVIMIDTNGPNFPVYQPLAAALGQKMGLILNEARQAFPSQFGRWLRQMVWLASFRAKFQARKRLNWLLAKLGLPLVQNEDEDNIYGIGHQLREQTHTYFSQPHVSDVPILLYRATLKPIKSEYDPTLGWNNYVPEEKITVSRVVGPHRDLLKPSHIMQVIDHLVPWLERESNTNSAGR